MGLLDSFSTVLDRIGGAAQGFFMSGGNPAGAVAGLAGVEQAKKQQKQEGLTVQSKSVSLKPLFRPVYV